MSFLRAVLTDEQANSYWEHVYLLPGEDLYDPEKFGRLKAIFEELLRERGDANLDLIHFDNPQLLDFLMYDHILNIVEKLIGPDFGLFSSHFISKEPGVGKATPWHEDFGYWHRRFESFPAIVTIWLAIDPSTRANGCMRPLCQNSCHLFLKNLYGLFLWRYGWMHKELYGEAIFG